MFKTGLIVVSISILSACVPINTEKSNSSLNFFDENSNNSFDTNNSHEKEESFIESRSLDITTGDKVFVAKKLEEVFGGTSELINDRVWRNGKIWGGTCSYYRESGCYLERTKTFSPTSTIKEGALLKICEELTRNNGTWNKFKNKYEVDDSLAPNKQDIKKYYNSFYESNKIDQVVIDKLLQINNVTANTIEAHQATVYAFCISPGWQIL